MRIIEVYKPNFTDVFCSETGWTTARDGFCVDCGSTSHPVGA